MSQVVSIIPGIQDGILWPRIKDGKPEGKSDIILGCGDRCYAVRFNRDNPVETLKEIAKALEFLQQPDKEGIAA